MTISPKVSVILTSYNHSKYIRESIESVLKQTFTDFELIIWDDASTDDSWHIISEYTDERIRAIRNESNQYMAYFRNAVSEVAQGEYIAIHHSDDIWEADKLEKQVAFLDSHPQVGAVFSNVLVIGENSEVFEDAAHFSYKIFDQPNRTRYEWLNHFFYQGNALCHPSVLIRRECYENCGPYRYGFGQANDFDMWVRLCLKYEIYVLPEKLVRFRILSHEMNTSGYRPETHIRGEFELFQILNNYRDIKSADEFVKVFPRSAEYFKPQGFDIGFALGMAALESGTSNYKKLFGLQLLFEALNDPDRAKRINELYRFGHNEFITLTAKYDVFSAELIPNLFAQVAEKEQINQQLRAQNQQVMEITSGRAWPLMVYFRRLRLRIAPPAGKLEKLLRLAFQGLRTWKNEGPGSVYRKVIQKIKLRFSARERGVAARSSASQKDMQAAVLLDLRSLSKILPGSLAYDVIILSSTDWPSRLQRPQQMAASFASEGHRVFYISTKLKKGSKADVRLVRDGVFEVRLPAINTHSGLDGVQWADAFHGVFDSLRYEFDIAEAVCIVDSPFWKSMAFSLRNNFGWKTIYDRRDEFQAAEDISQKVLQEERDLVQNSDLVLAALPSSLNELEYLNSNRLLVQNMADVPRIKQRIPALFFKVSIIVVTYNNVEYTRLCLKSIYEKTLYPNFEVIVVDNASTDGTREFLGACESEYENIRVIFNLKNEGFARANNFGIAEAHGNYIVLLNNDTVVTRVWLSKLISHLSDQRVGLVGSMTNGVSNEAQMEMLFTDIDSLDIFATRISKERAGILTSIKMLALYCAAGRREVFQKIGPLDERFGLGMFEDDDYSLRIRQAGYRIAVAEDVFIHHFGQSGFKILGDERYLALFEENRSKFESKWNIKWEQHVTGALVENRQFTADLQTILDAHADAAGVVIFPPTIGWNISLFQRPHQLARAFADNGFLVFFSTEAPVDDVKGFKQVLPGLYLCNSPWAVFDLVERPVIFTLPYNRKYLFQLRRPLIVYEVIDDLDVFPGDQTQLRINHDALLKEADVVLVTADRLMEQVKQIRADAIMCPNAVELDHFSRSGGSVIQPPPADLASIVKKNHPIIGYYGALARWFDYDLVRQAAQKHSDWEFVLIGPDHDNTLTASNILSMPNVHWLGSRDYSQLPNYLGYFTVATIPFVVNNITLATSPIKLFEYMAAAKPIVTSDMPECRKYPGVLVAQNSTEFIDLLEHALTLIHDSKYLQQLYQTAQENTWEVRVRQIVEAISRKPPMDDESA